MSARPPLPGLGLALQPSASAAFTPMGSAVAPGSPSPAPSPSDAAGGALFAAAGAATTAAADVAAAAVPVAMAEDAASGTPLHVRRRPPLPRTLRLHRQGMLPRRAAVDMPFLLPSLTCTPEDVYMPAPPIFGRGRNKIMSLRFCPVASLSHVLGGCTEAGVLSVVDTTPCSSSTSEQSANGGGLRRLAEVQAHDNAIWDFAWSIDTKLATASADRIIRLYDSSSADMRVVREFRGHYNSVKTVAGHWTNPNIFASGSRDGTIKIWDTRTVESVDSFGVPFHRESNSIVAPTLRKRLSNGSTSCSPRSITGTIFMHDEHSLLSSDNDGAIRCWDLRMAYTRRDTNPRPSYTLPPVAVGCRPRGIYSLSMDASGTMLLAGCTDGRLYLYKGLHATAQTSVTYMEGHQGKSFYIKAALSDDGRYAVSGSILRHAYVWQTERPAEAPFKLKGHMKDVCCAAIAPGRELAVATGSDDEQIRLWRVQRGDKAWRKIPNDDLIARSRHYSSCRQLPKRMMPAERRPLQRQTSASGASAPELATPPAPELTPGTVGPQDRRPPLLTRTSSESSHAAPAKRMRVLSTYFTPLQTAPRQRKPTSAGAPPPPVLADDPTARSAAASASAGAASLL